MEYERIEYLRKNDRIRTNPDTGKRGMVSRGVKKGVMVCRIDPDDHDAVIFGFSVCNSVDRFDYLNGIKEEGFGLELARNRAEKWSDHIGYFVQNSFSENEIWDEDHDLLIYKNPNTQEIVEIPPSVIVRFRTFIQRCKRYYKDKDFPEWIEKIERNEPEDLDLIDITEDFGQGC